MNSAATLPAFLNIHQALAWAAYRSLEAVSAASTAEGWAGFKLVNEISLAEGYQALRHALLRGILPASGRRKNFDFTPIPRETWLNLMIAPLLRENQSPYLEIIVDKDDLLQVFPAPKAGRGEDPRPRGRPRKHNYERIHELAAAAVAVDPDLTRYKIALSIRPAYFKQTGLAISESTIAKTLGKLGYK